MYWVLPDAKHCSTSVGAAMNRMDRQKIPVCRDSLDSPVCDRDRHSALGSGKGVNHGPYPEVHTEEAGTGAQEPDCNVL